MPLFYNLYTVNNTASETPLHLESNLTIPLMSKPSEWDVSIVRFVLPGYDIPIFTFTPDLFHISMSYNGSTVVLPVVWDTSVQNTGYLLYDIQAFIHMLNTTLTSAWTALKVLQGGLPGSGDMPYFTYSETSQLISLTANAAHYASNLTTPIVIGWDEPLNVKIQGIPTLYNTLATTQYTALFLNQYTNVTTVGTNTYYTMTQEGPSFDNMVDTDMIVIQTNMPITQEISGVSTGLPILADFAPSEWTISNIHNRITYNPTGPPFRQASLQGDQPFYNISCYCYLSSTSPSVNSTLGPLGNLTPMVLAPGQSASIKLMFTKKIGNKYA